MRRVLVLVLVAIVIGACTATTPVMTLDDLWDEREKSKSEFQKKYFGKELAAAGKWAGDSTDLDFSKSSNGYVEVYVNGSSLETIKCQIEEKDVAPFKNVAKGTAVAVKGKLVSGENDAYPELRPCTLITK